MKKWICLLQCYLLYHHRRRHHHLHRYCNQYYQWKSSARKMKSFGMKSIQTWWTNCQRKLREFNFFFKLTTIEKLIYLSKVQGMKLNQKASQNLLWKSFARKMELFIVESMTAWWMNCPKKLREFGFFSSS